MLTDKEYPNNEQFNEPTDIYEYESFIDIDCEGGRIGRFRWLNQINLTIEQWDKQGFLVCKDVIEYPGFFNFVFQIGDFWVFDFNKD